MTCAVVVAAWAAQAWIGQCLNSIARQRLPAGWTLDLRVGVDGCALTSAALRARGTGHWYSRANVGPYLIRNSLMRAPADAYAVFDADDIMLPDYLATLLPMACSCEGLAGGARQTVDVAGRPRMGPLAFVSGVCVISAPALQRLGGYRAWRVAADRELVGRARQNGVTVRAHPRVLFHRREHPDSLTMAPATGPGSALRKAAHRMAYVLPTRGAPYVRPRRVPLEWRP